MRFGTSVHHPLSVCDGAAGDRRTAGYHTNITQKSDKGAKTQANPCKPKSLKLVAIPTNLAPRQQIDKTANWIS